MTTCHLLKGSEANYGARKCRREKAQRAVHCVSQNRIYLLVDAKLKAAWCYIMLTSRRRICIIVALLTFFFFMFAQGKYGVKKRPPPPANCLPLGGSCKSPGAVCCDFCAFCQCRLFRTVCYCRMGNPRCWAVSCTSSSCLQIIYNYHSVEW